MSFTRERTILAKIEVTEGTDPVPTGNANAILCGNITIAPLAGTMTDRDLAFPDFSKLPQSFSNKNITLQFDVELQSSGAAGTAPAFGPLLRACALAETITAATKVEYSPVSISQESVAIYSNEGGILHQLLGTRGNVSLIFAKDVIPMLRFNLIGRWSAASAAALPAIDVTAFIPGLPMGKVNTPTFTVDGYAAVLESLQIDIDNKAVHRDRPNAEYVATPDRMVSGQMQIEAPAIGTKNFLAIAAAQPSTLVVRQLIHGVTAGKIVQIDEPALQLIQPGYVDLDGIRGLSMNTRSTRSAGNDEIKLTFK